MANLITPTEAAGYLGIAVASAPSQTLIDTAETLLLDYIGRPLISASRTEYYSAVPGQKTIRLRIWPVASVTSVNVDPRYNFGQNANVTAPLLLTAGQDYALIWNTSGVASQGLLEYFGLVNGGYGWTGPYAPLTGYGLSVAARNANFGWPVGQGNIKVVYTAGFTTIPDDFKIAVAYQSRWLQKVGTSAGVIMQSETLGQNSYTMADINTPAGMKVAGAVGIIQPMVAQMVAKYRDVTLGIPL